MKKVLISLEELRERCFEYHYDISPDDWFDAQPDASAIEYDIALDYFKEAIKKLDDGLQQIYKKYPHLKDGGENDN